MNACLLMLCLSFGSGDRPPDPWFAEDKWKHFVASFVVTSISASGARMVGVDADDSVLVGAAAGSGAAVWKELRDANRPEGFFSVPDLVWDFAGIGAGAAVLSQIR